MKFTMPSASRFPYPESLNVSAEKFEGCCWDVINDFETNRTGSFALSGTLPAATKKRKRQRDQFLPPSTLSDDLILSRISSYLSGSSFRGSASHNSRNCDPNSPQKDDRGKIRSNNRKLDGIWADWGRVGTTGIGPILAEAGVEEVEALNQSARAGQCQFATVAAALSIDGSLMASDKDGFRPDLELRKLVLHAISHNPECYRHFLVVPGRRTRSSSQEGGTGVDLTHYLHTMSKSSTDGDHVTLQALCDVLKITIRIVKPVTHHSSTQSTSYDGTSDYLSDDSSSTFSSNPPVLDPLSLSTGVFPIIDKCSSFSRNIYISEEMQPRRLERIDRRIQDVQNLVRGRLVWLSHVGDAHFRYLRPLGLSHLTPQGRKEEHNITMLLQKGRLQRLVSVCNSNDGYIHTCGIVP